MATPQIPPRPSRSSNLAPSQTMEIPKIPPRPGKRSVDRSVSPNRDSYARSPLNDPSFLHNGFTKPKSVHAGESIRRPPSVTLPSIGQEGSEYASFDESTAPEQTKNVAGDLPLHQPKAAAPASVAKSRIQTVTRTDSSQAAAAGLSKYADSDKGGNMSATQSDTSNGTKSRPQSIYREGEEHGIPEIGLQVPMYPNAGDVQAPTPSPFSQPATGIGFFNNGSQGNLAGKHHTRTKSGRQVFNGPPGSYGLHGHGIIPQNQFEKSWYEKHPQDAAREKQGEYGPAIQDNRKEYHLSKDDLNKLIHGKGDIGLATSREAISTPDEEIGYRASEEYASRIASPRYPSRPPSISIGHGLTKTRSSSSHTAHAESPLRKSAFPDNQLDIPSNDQNLDQAMESEAEDDVIHIPANSYRSGSVHDLSSSDPRANPDLDGWRTPILAADEVAKRQAEYRDAAVSPELSRRDSGDSDLRKVRSHSRNGSLPQLGRHSSQEQDVERHGTPLDDVKEYEPLFDDSDEEQRKKAKLPVQKLKRPDLARHHFPSQDVWEDTPSSLQLQTTVDTPEPEAEAPLSSTTEKPSGSALKNEAIPTEDDESFLAKSKLPPHMQAEKLRPNLQHRFPSQDVWEDAPEHVYQYTTIETPPETTEPAAEEPQAEPKPTIPARPLRAKAPGSAETSPVDKKAPLIPERPKPQVPARPSKPLKRESSEDVTTEAALAKSKPAVPARPGGAKLAALKAGFLNDLNAKIGLGPQAPKKEEPEPEVEAVQEKAPLADARKGRAKGPQRRRPAASPSGAAAAPAETKSAAGLSLSLAPVVTIFSLSHDGSLAGPTTSSLLPPKDAEFIASDVGESTAAVETAPAPVDAEAEAFEPLKPSTSEASVQTGETNVKLTRPDGSNEEATIYLGGKAQEEGHVTVDKDGVEHTSEPKVIDPVPAKDAEA